MSCKTKHHKGSLSGHQVTSPLRFLQLTKEQALILIIIIINNNGYNSRRSMVACLSVKRATLDRPLAITSYSRMPKTNLFQVVHHFLVALRCIPSIIPLHLHQLRLVLQPQEFLWYSGVTLVDAFFFDGHSPEYSLETFLTTYIYNNYIYTHINNIHTQGSIL